MRLMPDWWVWRTRAVIEVPSVVRFWGRQASAVLAEVQCVLRQVLSASIGKRSLMAVAAVIIPLAAIIALLGISVRDELVEDELIGSLPISLAGSTEVRPVHTLAAVTGGPPADDAETLMQSSGAFRDLVPSPRPRPSYKPRPRRVHKMRNAPNNALPILSLAGSTEVRPVHTLAAVTGGPPADDAETLVQSSGTFRDLVPSPRPRPSYKPRPRRVHKMHNAPNNALPILSLLGATEVQPVRPLAALMNALPAGDAETLAQSFVASGEQDALPILPPAGSTEVQPVHTLAAVTGGPPADDAETLVQSPGAFRDLVPSPRPRPSYKPRPRRVHKMRNAPNSVAAGHAVAILKDLRDPSQIDKVVKDNPSNVFLLLMAEMRRASQETGHLVEKLMDEIEPAALTKEMNYASASRAQLEAYRLDLKAAETNAMAAIPRYVALLESEREKVEVVVQSLNMDDRYIRAALSGLDKRQAQSTDITSKILLANAELYRAIGGYLAILVEQFGHYKVSTNGHFMFSSQSIADRYNDASRQIKDAIKHVAELEEERKSLARFQQEEWARFALGK
jgi:hypothetical protein